MVQLSEVASTSAGGRLGYTKQDHYGAGGVPAFSAAGQDGFVERAEFRDVDGVVLSAIGANCGRTFLAKGSWTTLANTQAIIPNDRLLASYLWHRTNREDYWPRSGSAQPFIKPSSIGACWILLPPIGEQRRIAEILDTLDEAIRATEALIAKLEQVKKGLLHDLLTRGIDDNGELRNPERHPEQFKDSPLGRIPREWDVCPLLDLAEVRSGIAKNSNRALNNPVDVHYLRVANVQDGFLDLSEMSKIRINRAEVAKYAVQAGDVLMNEGGDLDKLGRGALWRGEYHPCVHQNHVFVVRCGGGLEPAFLDAWTGSAPARRYFIVAGKQTTNLASINKTAISQLPVALPPMREQRAIVQRLDGHRERVLAEEQSLTKLRLLKTGLMDDLLSGRVRVSVESQEVSA